MLEQAKDAQSSALEYAKKQGLTLSNADMTALAENFAVIELADASRDYDAILEANQNIKNITQQAEALKSIDLIASLNSKKIQLIPAILPPIQPYNLTKATLRTIWQKLGVDWYLRNKGYLTSAWMLEHSLQDNPSNEWRGNDSRIAGLIKEDPAFKNDLDRALKLYENQNSFRVERHVINFEGETDLYYSIHGCGIAYSGKKQNDGTWLIDCRMDDRYDFTQVSSLMKEKQFSWKITKGTLANDAALISSLLGVIVPYEIVVDFQVRR